MKLFATPVGDPITGEPYAGNPPVRFGGRGGRDNRSSLPYRNGRFSNNTEIERAEIWETFRTYLLTRLSQLGGQRTPF